MMFVSQISPFQDCAVTGFTQRIMGMAINHPISVCGAQWSARSEHTHRAAVLPASHCHTTELRCNHLT